MTLQATECGRMALPYRNTCYASAHPRPLYHSNTDHCDIKRDAPAVVLHYHADTFLCASCMPVCPVVCRTYKATQEYRDRPIYGALRGVKSWMTSPVLYNHGSFTLIAFEGFNFHKRVIWCVAVGTDDSLRLRKSRSSHLEEPSKDKSKENQCINNETNNGACLPKWPCKQNENTNAHHNEQSKEKR